MEHRWVHEPLEETLHGARRLTVSIVDELLRDGWEQLAQVAGIPRSRWCRHHPVGDGPLVELVDGEPAFDAAAWARFASLVPGAVALRTRTAAMLGIAPGELHPPGRAPLRIVDLWRARRLRRTLRRASRDLDTELARLAWSLDLALDPVLADGDDGTPFSELPAYALAARLELAVAAGRDWRTPVLVDLASGAATAQLLRLLTERGRSPGEALLELASRTTSGSAGRPEYLDELARTASRESTGWLDGRDGWYALRSLLLEAPALRSDPTGAYALVHELPQRHPAPLDQQPLEPELEEAVEQARRLTALRERAGHLRADLHAALRGVTQTLAARLEADGSLGRADLAFDLHWRDLVRVARGGHHVHMLPADTRAVDAPSAVQFAPELRGIPASVGTASGPVVVLDDPSLDASVDGAVLVCRVTDPAWLPLMLRCAALVTERGGPLSHAAIVARELGLPAVVGARGAVAAGRAASLAHVDGAAGLVRLEPLD